MNESIETKIELIEADIAAAYTEAEAKGATMPQVQGSANLPTAIRSIPEAVQPTLITKQITENSTYTAADDGADGYSEVAVNLLFMTTGVPYFKNLHFPSTVEEISTFFLFSNLEIISFDSGCKRLMNSVFRGCHLLKKVVLPNTLTTIEPRVFQDCDALTTINFPSSLTNISSGNQPFYGCTSLENVTIENNFNCNNLNLSASTRYTAETIVSWLEALADRTGQTPFTLTIGATNLNKLTAEQKAIATNKNWTLA